METILYSVFVIVLPNEDLRSWLNYEEFRMLLEHKTVNQKYT